MDLSAISDHLRASLDAKTAARDVALAASRAAIRACGNSIRALHRGELEVAASLREQARSHLDEGLAALQGHDDMRHAGFIHDAQKELVEAHLTAALVSRFPIPGAEDLGVPPAAYLKGMAEAVGELRRHVLDLMRKGELGRCEDLLAEMDDLHTLLTSMDYPDGITFGLRRLTDIARSIIERTRGDFTVALIQSSLHDALEAHTAGVIGDGSILDSGS